MPLCNLSESVHNKWLEAFGNKGDDLYVAIVHNFVRAFLQCVGYHGFNGGGKGSGGPSLVELKLCLSHETTRLCEDPSRLTKAIMDYLEAEKLCNRQAYLEGA